MENSPELDSGEALARTQPCRRPSPGQRGGRTPSPGEATSQAEVGSEPQKGGQGGQLCPPPPPTPLGRPESSHLPPNLEGPEARVPRPRGSGSRGHCASAARSSWLPSPRTRALRPGGAGLNQKPILTTRTVPQATTAAGRGAPGLVRPPPTRTEAGTTPGKRHQTPGGAKARFPGSAKPGRDTPARGRRGPGRHRTRGRPC